MKNILANLKKSWTIWFNALSLLLAGAEMHFELLKAYIGERFYGVALFALIMVNMVLRLKTELKHMKTVTSAKE